MKYKEKRWQGVVQYLPLPSHPFSHDVLEEKSSFIMQEERLQYKCMGNPQNLKEALLSARNFYLQGISRYPHSKA